MCRLYLTQYVTVATMIGENLNFGGTAFQMKNKANKKLSQEVPTFQNKIELQSFNPFYVKHWVESQQQLNMGIANINI